VDAYLYHTVFLGTYHYLQMRLSASHADPSQPQVPPRGDRKHSVYSHPVPESNPGSRRITRQSDYGAYPQVEGYQSQRGSADHVGYPSIAPTDSHHSRRGTADQLAFPNIAPAEGQHSRRGTADHVAYPTLEPTNRQSSRREIADLQMIEGALPANAPYPSMASPERPVRRTAEQSRRVSQQAGTEGYSSIAPEEDQKSRRTTADGRVTADGRQSQKGDMRSGRPSNTGMLAAGQYAAASGSHERWGTDADVTVSYAPAGERLHVYPDDALHGASKPQDASSSARLQQLCEVEICARMQAEV